MKKSGSHSFQLMTVVFIILASFSAGFSMDDVHIGIVSDNGGSIVIRCQIVNYQAELVFIGNEEYTRVWIPGEAVSYEKGAPALPYINRSIIIPDDQLMTVQVLSTSYQDIPVKIAPSKGLLSRNIDPDSIPYEFGETYKENSFYPAQLATLGDPYIMRDHRGVVVNINPFQYNPATAILRVYKEMTIEVVPTGCGGKNVLTRTIQRSPIHAFEELYKVHFLNYRGDSTESGYAEGPSPTYTPLDEQGDILVIAYDSWISNMNPYVTHKIDRGFNVNVVGVSTIGNDPVSIKSYIQDIYNMSDLAFVLLVGDATQVATPTASGGASDPSYAKLAGNDDYPEIMVGRFSANTAAEVDTQVQRTVDYESMPAYAQSWFKQGVGIGSAQGAGQGDDGQADYQHIEEIRGWLMNFGYTLVDQIYDPGATDVMVSNAVNNGRSIINYCGHGSATSWGTTGFNTADVAALVNDNMLPFIISVACNNGEFNHYDPCFGEAWLRATNPSTGAPTGAIAAYMSSISQSWAPPMEAQDEFNIRYTDPAQPYSYYGTLCFAGSCSMMDKYGTGGVDMFNTWIIFGDPSVRILGPHGLKVTPTTGFTTAGPAGGPYDQMSMDYTLENLDAVPTDYQVTTFAPWITITNASGTIPSGGSSIVTISLNDASRNFDAGHYSEKVRFINLRNHDGDTARTVLMKVGMTAVNYWTLDADPAWTRSGEWQYGVPTGNGGGRGLYPDPKGGATGSNVFGANINGDIQRTVGNPYYLTAGPFDYSAVSDVTLKFQRWLNTTGSPKITNTVDVSNDGTNWTNIWTSGGQIASNAWSLQSYDISAVASSRSTVFVRWGYKVNERLGPNESSWNIDDVKVEGVPSTARIMLNVAQNGLSWNSIVGAIAYDVVRGDLGTLLSNGGNFTLAADTCLGNNLSGTSLNYTAVPAAGQGHWFLVRGVSLTGPMTYQSLAGNQVGLRDEEIDAATSACP